MNTDICKIDAKGKRLLRPHVKTKFCVEKTFFKDKDSASPSFNYSYRGDIDIDLVKAAALGCIAAVLVIVSTVARRIK